jgi:hypothetical protein
MMKRALSFAILLPLLACGDAAEGPTDAGVSDGASPDTVQVDGGSDAVDGVAADVETDTTQVVLWDAPHSDDWRSAFDATSFGAFMSIWGPTPTDIYTVGGQPTLRDTEGDGVAFRYDGASWSELEVPAGGMLNWVHGAQDDVWMVGELGRALLWRDGALVREDALGTEDPLWGVWAAAPDDVWAVGGNARDPAGTPVLGHYDGEAWELIELPELDRPSPALFKVWGTSGDNVFAVGARGVVLGYDGESWTQLPSGTGEDIVSLWGRGPNDIVAVGGRSNGVLGRYDGTSWTFETLERVSGLNGSWMDYAGVVYSVGVGGRILKFAPGSSEFEDISSPSSNILHAVFGLNEGPAFAVGGTLASNPPYEGDVLIATQEP